ncbi:MAG: JDVT-CTERM system CAAX-type protease [Halobacteria archaeon]|nr:JDVT-CTERM system CAAX-type protease [Halobacteria archaeon]
MKPRTRLREDPLFLAAILAAPLVWLLLYFILRPELDWSWPLYHSARFLWPVLFFPVVEEILFRGLLQEFVRDYFSKDMLGPISVANLATSLVFTGLHFFYQPALWAALVFIPSLVFGFFKDRTGRLTAPIILHMFYNFGFLWVFSAP